MKSEKELELDFGGARMLRRGAPAPWTGLLVPYAHKGCRKGKSGKE